LSLPISERIREKLSGARQYFEEHNSCVYCDLIEQEREVGTRIILETDHFIAMTPFAARFLFEVQILPKVHNCDFVQGVKAVEQDLAFVLKSLLKKFQLGLDDPAYNYVIHTAPLRHNPTVTKKWQTIEEDYHWHIELIPRLTRIAGFEKGTEFFINSIPPENTAEYLRGVKIE